MSAKSFIDSETTYSGESLMQLCDDNCADFDTSTTSIKVYITSSMVLAATIDELAAWAHAVKLDWVIEATVPNVTRFDLIRNLQATSRVFPGWLKTSNSAEYNFIAPNHRKWKDALCSTLQRSSMYSFGRNWEADLPYAIATIFQICHHHEIVRRLERNELGSRMDMRFCVDTLVAYICEADADGLARYLANPTLRLPDCTTDRAKLATTTVDGVIALPIINFEPYLVGFDLQQAASAFVAEETRHLVLVHCVTVFGSTGSGENQMKLAMVSALHQKKILHIRNQFVFGVFQRKRDFLQVNAGCWINDKRIRIYQVGTFSLNSAASLVQFYLVLREIKRIAGGYKEQLIRSGPFLQASMDASPPRNEWAPMCPGTTHESAGELTIQPTLNSLGQWDLGDRINTFRHSIGSCTGSSN